MKRSRAKSASQLDKEEGKQADQPLSDEESYDEEN